MDEQVRAVTIRTLHKRIREANDEIARLRARLDGATVERELHSRGAWRRRRVGAWIDEEPTS